MHLLNSSLFSKARASFPAQGSFRLPGLRCEAVERQPKGEQKALSARLFMEFDTSLRLEKKGIPMQNKNAMLFLRTFGLGVVAGMRSLTAPALLRAWLSRQRHLAPTPLEHLVTPTVMSVIATGELVADKLPFTPDRTCPPSVAFRALSGALVGGSFCAANRRSPVAGALLGAAGAVAATYAAFHIRRFLVKERGLPDMVVALAEDAATNALGRSLLPD